MLSGKAQATNAGGEQGAFRSAESFSQNQYSEAVVADAPYIMGLLVRAVDGGTIQGYALVTGSAVGAMELHIIANAGLGGSVITTFGAVYPVAGNTIRFEAEQSGMNVILRAFMDTGGGLTQVGTDYTDTTLLYSGGSPGLFGLYVGYDSFDSWAGGDLAAPPPSAVCHLSLLGAGC